MLKAQINNWPFLKGTQMIHAEVKQLRLHEWDSFNCVHLRRICLQWMKEKKKPAAKFPPHFISGPFSTILCCFARSVVKKQTTKMCWFRALWHYNARSSLSTRDDLGRWPLRRRWRELMQPRHSHWGGRMKKCLDKNYPVMGSNFWPLASS